MPPPAVQCQVRTFLQPQGQTMKKANLVLMAAMTAAGLAGVAGGSLLPVTAAYAKEKDKAAAPATKEKLSATVAKPLQPKSMCFLVGGTAGPPGIARGPV